MSTTTTAAPQKTDMRVPTEILRQLGGKRFILMTGVKNLAGDENALHMGLRRNKSKAKWLSITLNSMDTYDMKFQGIKAGDFVTVQEFEGIYCDQLQDIFTQVTGMYTQL